ncbi:MAG TPA: lactate utilization protein [Thermoplasmata archaeon]|nr:lactate utilization protein [Thermoplasmata archaeon]
MSNSTLASAEPVTFPTAFPSLASGPALARFSLPASSDRVERAAGALRTNGIEVRLVRDREEARAAVLGLIPEGSEVLTVTSQTLTQLGLDTEIQRSTRFHPVRGELTQLMKEGKTSEARRLGAAPDVVIGSVHAITERGEVVIASATGSQLGPYAYGARRVIWVAGTQKIVRDLTEAVERLEQHTFPLEDARAKKVYGAGSAIAKVLLVNREFQPGRISIILVPENLGF